MQEVNLLNDLPQKKIFLPAKQMFQIAFALFFILLSITVWQSTQLIFKYRTLRIEKRLSKEVEASFVNLTKQHPIISRNKSLKLTVKKLSKKLKQDKKKYETLSQYILKLGFSTYMNMLAEKVSPSISLNTIFISHVKRNITLYGKSKRAKDVSKMVERLYLSKLLQGVVFKQYVLSRGKGLIEFEVATSKLNNQKDILASNFKEGKIQQQLLKNSR